MRFCKKGDRFRSVAKSAYFVLNKAVILYFLTLFFSLFPLFLKKAADFIRYLQLNLLFDRSCFSLYIDLSIIMFVSVQ